MRVLVHKTDHLGDFVLAFPCFWELTRSENIDFSGILAGALNREWKEILPWLPEIMEVPNPRYTKEKGLRGLRRGVGSALSCALLRGRDYDWGVDLVSTRNDFWGKVFLSAAGCRRLAGPDGAYSFLLDVQRPEPRSHQTRLLASRFPAEWEIEGAAVPSDFMPSSLRWKGESGKILLAPYAGTRAKEWPLESWKQLGSELGNAGRFIVAAGEKERFQEDFRDLDCELVVVRSIRESLEELRDSQLVVVQDTGMAHFAWLVGTPTVQLFSGTTKADRWSALDAEVLYEFPDCWPCYSEVCQQEKHWCMERIGVDKVLGEVEKMQTI